LQAIVVGKKGQKTKRGQGEIYDEPKSVRKTILLTPTAVNILIKLAKAKNISFSELIEQIARSQTADSRTKPRL
jgi:hypothetical protein